MRSFHLSPPLTYIQHATSSCEATINACALFQCPKELKTETCLPHPHWALLLLLSEIVSVQTSTPGWNSSCRPTLLWRKFRKAELNIKGGIQRHQKATRTSRTWGTKIQERGEMHWEESSILCCLPWKHLMICKAGCRPRAHWVRVFSSPSGKGKQKKSCGLGIPEQQACRAKALEKKGTHKSEPGIQMGICTWITWP